MDFTGKKTERVLMRVTEDMRREVEALASLEGRPINHQYRVLIMIGLEHARAASVSGMRRSLRQPMSTSAELSATAGNQRLPNQLLLPNTGGPVVTKKRRSA